MWGVQGVRMAEHGTKSQVQYLVRVELERQLPVRALDLLIGRARRDAEDLKRVERPNLVRAARVSMRDWWHCACVGSAPPRPRS